MLKFNSDTKNNASDPVSEQTTLLTASCLEKLPLEIFCIIVKDMSIAGILTIAKTSKMLKDKASSDTLWKQLIVRDFGDYALSAYYMQLMNSHHVLTAKLYYKFLFKGFEDKIRDFTLFFDNYLLHVEVHSTCKGQASNQFYSELKNTIETLGTWAAFNTETRLKEVNVYYGFYRKAISQLGCEESQSSKLCLPPLAYAIHNRFSLTAISLISLPEVNVNQYANKGVERSIILDAMLYDKAETIVNALLERTDLNLFVRGEYGRSPLLSAYSIEVKTKVFYKMLCSAGADGVFKILPFIIESNIRKKDVFKYMCTLVQNSASIQENLKILYFSIAKSEGKYCSALSYYFHEIKSPHDVVKKVKTLIEIQEGNLFSNILENIKYPELINNNLDYWAVEDRSVPAWRMSRETLVRALESEERSIEDIDDLAVMDVNDDDHRYSIALVNAIFAHSAKQSIRRFKLENLGLAILSIGVGLAFGLGLGLGAHAHIAASVLSSIISTVLIFAISARYNYCRHMGPDLDSKPVSQPVVSSNATTNNNPLTTSTEATFLPSVDSSSKAITTASNLSSASNNHHSQMHLK